MQNDNTKKLISQITRKNNAIVTILIKIVCIN